MAKCKACCEVYRKAYYQRNKERYASMCRAWAQRNKDKIRSTYLKADHGITLADYVVAEVLQDGVCGICRQRNSEPHSPNGKPRRLVVDHCHVTNDIRGLLCSRCNRGLGMFQDDVEILRRAISYLVTPPLGNLGFKHIVSERKKRNTRSDDLRRFINSDWEASHVDAL